MVHQFILILPITWPLFCYVHADSTEERNRTALSTYENVSVEGIPQYTTFTPATSGASGKNTNVVENTSLPTSTSTTTGRVTRSGKGKNGKAAVSTPPSDAAVALSPALNPVTTDLRDSHSTSDASSVMFPQLIGAAVVPLSLLGPVHIKNDHTHTRNNSTHVTSDETVVQHWYPLATHDSNLVNSVESVCSGLVHAIECTLMPPLQDTLTFTSRIQVIQAGGSRVWLQWPVQYLPHILRSAVQAEPSATLLTAVLRAKHSLHGNDMFRVQCIPQGSSAVLQLSVSTGVVCNISTLVAVGKALLKRILQNIRADYTNLKFDRAFVNYAPLTSLNALLPFVHYTSVTLTLPATIFSVASLAAAHSCADQYETNAYIQYVLRALCTSLGVELKYIAYCEDWVSDVEFLNSGTNITVSARVPVVLTQYELHINTTVAIGADKCRELFLGNNNHKEACANIVSSLVLCSYIAFLQDS